MIATPEISALVASHRRTAERVSRRFADRLPAGVTVEDLTAECWSAIWRAAERSDCGRTCEVDFGAYAFGAALREARQFLRFASRRGIKGAPKSLRLVVVNEPATDDDESPRLLDLATRPDAGDGEFTRPIAWWHERLACLSPAQRRVVVARVIRGASFTQIGRAEGYGREAARRAWHVSVETLLAHHPDLEAELRD